MLLVNADAVQTMVARGLVDPAFLARAAEPDGSDWVDSRTLETLTLFRGFIARIKHGGLRSIAPLTLRLMHAHRLEIAFFTDHAPAYLAARTEGITTPAGLFVRFEEALVAFLPRLPQDVSTALGAVLRHEGRLWRTRAPPHASPDPAKCDPAAPRLADGVAIVHYPIDVLGLCADLARDAHAVPVAEHGDHVLLYRPLPGGARVDPIDPFAACVLSGLDGYRTLARICGDAAAMLGIADAAPIADLIAEAAAQGIVATPSGTDAG